MQQNAKADHAFVPNIATQPLRNSVLFTRLRECLKRLPVKYWKNIIVVYWIMEKYGKWMEIYVQIPHTSVRDLLKTTFSP